MINKITAAGAANYNYTNYKQPVFGHISPKVGAAVRDLTMEENACAYSDNREGVKKALIIVLDKIKETGSIIKRSNEKGDLGERLPRLCKEYGIEYPFK